MSYFHYYVLNTDVCVRVVKKKYKSIAINVTYTFCCWVIIKVIWLLFQSSQDIWVIDHIFQVTWHWQRCVNTSTQLSQCFYNKLL